MKDGCAVVFNERWKKERTNVSLYPGSNVRGNGLPLILAALLWMPLFPNGYTPVSCPGRIRQTAVIVTLTESSSDLTKSSEGVVQSPHSVTFTTLNAVKFIHTDILPFRKL